MSDEPPTRSPLATRAEACAFLRVSRKSFDRHVAPDLGKITVGARVLYSWKEILGWLDRQRVGASRETSAREIGSRASRTRVKDTSDPRAQEIVEKLKNGRRRSSLRSLKDDGE